MLAMLVPCLSPAQDMSARREGIRDTWASVIYCQQLYANPQLTVSIYPGDLRSCELADEQMQKMVAESFTASDRLIIENSARAKARAIRSSTPNNNQAVMACRQQCRTLESSESP
jgi:hypothetical protein